MTYEIMKQLKTGSISNVVKFGGDLPEAPYVVVKPETYPGGRGYRIITHFLPASAEYMTGGKIYTPMDDYVQTELPTLLSGFEFTNNKGQSMTVKDTAEITDIEAVSDDSTVSMERLFYVPFIQF